MKTCKVCINSFHVGHKGYCSKNCYLEVLQTKLDNAFRNDRSHIELLAA